MVDWRKKKSLPLLQKKSLTITESEAAAKTLFAHFGIDTRTNSQSFEDQNDPIKGVEGSVSFGGIELNFFQRAYKSPLRCFPQGSFHYSTALSSGEDEVSLEDYDAFGAEVNCAYNLAAGYLSDPLLRSNPCRFSFKKTMSSKAAPFRPL